MSDDPYGPPDESYRPGWYEPPVEVDPVVLAQRVGQLGDQVEDLTTAVEALMMTLQAAPGGPWHYGLITQGRRRELLIELGEWVRWLEHRYLVNLPAGDYPLPACWWRHPVAVELLTALMVSHKAVYTKSQAVPSRALVEWHTYALTPAFALLKSTNTFGRCEGGHEDPVREAHHDVLAYVGWVDEVAPDLELGDGSAPDKTAPAGWDGGE